MQTRNRVESAPERGLCRAQGACILLSCIEMLSVNFCKLASQPKIIEVVRAKAKEVRVRRFGK